MDISAFWLHFRDLQTSTYVPNTDPPGFLTKNAAAATSKGFEWFIAWRATPALQVSWTAPTLTPNTTDFRELNV